MALLIPIPIYLKDGGTVEYKALTYVISKIHRLNSNSNRGFADGIIIEILGIKIYDNVIVAIPNNTDSKVEEIAWE